MAYPNTYQLQADPADVYLTGYYAGSPQAPIRVDARTFLPEIRTSAPTSADDYAAGYRYGSRILDSSAHTAWRCVGDGLWAEEGAGGGGGVNVHAQLSGLAADDHPQYHTDARGDARYALVAHATAGGNPHGVTAAQAGAVPVARIVGTQYSIAGGGALDADRTLSLVGDAASPANGSAYGMQAGVRGWHRFAPCVVSNAAPTATDDETQGYVEGWLWVWTGGDPNTGPVLYVLWDAMPGAAVWRAIDAVGSGGGGGAAAGPDGALQLSIGGAVGYDPSLIFDTALNVLKSDFELRSVIFPHNDASISGSSTACPFGWRQRLKLTITGAVTAPLALPTEVKEVTTSAAGIANQYTVEQFVELIQDAGAPAGGYALPADFLSLYGFRGTPPRMPAAAGAGVLLQLTGVWDGDANGGSGAWLSWTIEGAPNAIIDADVTVTPFDAQKYHNHLWASGAASLIRLPAAAADRQILCITNDRSVALALQASGTETVNGSLSIAPGDTIALIDRPSAGAQWRRI